VPAGSETAEVGEWAPGPGAAFLNAAKSVLGGLPFIAEDLGLITPDVTALLNAFELPGTRVLQFAFDGDPANPHLPDNHPRNCVAYTGTHDNATTRDWFERLSEPEQQRVWAYLKRAPGHNREAAREFIRMAWSSTAVLAIAPFQDVLNLGVQGRMNVPGYAHGNWRWRATSHMLSARTFRWLEQLTVATNRHAQHETKEATA
jgi:4-alpha-glucanotransferase